MWHVYNSGGSGGTICELNSKRGRVEAWMPDGSCLLNPGDMDEGEDAEYLNDNGLLCNSMDEEPIARVIDKETAQTFTSTDAPDVRMMRLPRKGKYWHRSD